MTMWVKNDAEIKEIQTEDFGIYKRRGYVKAVAPDKAEEKKGKKKED